MKHKPFNRNSIALFIDLKMAISEKRFFLTQILLAGLLYVSIYTLLAYFVYPVNLTEGSNIISRVLGAAFFFGVFSGLFSGLFAGLRVNRLNLSSPITSGLIAGAISVLVGSILFPIVGALVRVNVFGENPADFNFIYLFLINLSLVGVWPGMFVSLFSGSLGGVLSSGIAPTNRESKR